MESLFISLVDREWEVVGPLLEASVLPDITSLNSIEIFAPLELNCAPHVVRSYNRNVNGE